VTALYRPVDEVERLLVVPAEPLQERDAGADPFERRRGDSRGYSL
jgi:hypothetical protein